MSIVLRAIGVLATVLLLGGLALGLVPQTHDFPPSVYDGEGDGGGGGEVSCGSPFLPANSADAADDVGQAEAWDGGGSAEFDEVDRAEACETVLGDGRVAGISSAALGLVGLAYLLWLRRSEKRYEAAAAREAYWRAQGYAPAAEIPGPPPGWRRVGNAPAEPQVDAPVR